MCIHLDVATSEFNSTSQIWPSVCYTCPARQIINSNTVGCNETLFVVKTKPGYYYSRPHECPSVNQDHKSDKSEQFLKRILKR